MDLRLDFAGLALEHPIMNAAGTCKLKEQVRELARSAVSAVVLGSITLHQRHYNPGTVFWFDHIKSLNSLGLPNPGRDYYQRELPEMIARVHDAGKALIVSVAGFSPEEYGILAEVALEGGADAVELNLGCPNVWDEGRQKRIACFDLRLMHEILFEQVFPRIGEGYRVGVKPSPFSDPVYLEEFGSVISPGRIRFLTATNTFPNALELDEVGEPRITPAGGLAGLAGPALKPIALGQVAQYRKILPPGMVDIAAAGGARSGRDVLDFVRVGAKVVQINTAYSETENVGVFGKILTEYVDLAEAGAGVTTPSGT